MLGFVAASECAPIQHVGGLCFSMFKSCAYGLFWTIRFPLYCAIVTVRDLAVSIFGFGSFVFKQLGSLFDVKQQRIEKISNRIVLPGVKQQKILQMLDLIVSLEVHMIQPTYLKDLLLQLLVRN
jgi:hypothetical protein